METSLILHRKERKMFYEYPGKHANPFFDRHPIFIIDLNPLHATAWRVALKNEATKIFFF